MSEETYSAHRQSLHDHCEVFSVHRHRPQPGQRHRLGSVCILSDAGALRCRDERRGRIGFPLQPNS